MPAAEICHKTSGGCGKTLLTYNQTVRKDRTTTPKTMKKTACLLLTLLVLLACNKPELTTDAKPGVIIVGLDPGTDTTRAKNILDAAASIDAQWIRLGIIWAAANPQPFQYELDWYDWLFAQAQQRGLKVTCLVLFTPQWASSCPDCQDFYYYVPTEQNITDSLNGYDFLRIFAGTVASRYKNLVNHWECWNEPDMFQGLKTTDSTASSAHYYAKMLHYFYQGIKTGNPAATVLIGGLAQADLQTGCDPDYLEKLLTDSLYPAARNFDIMNIHTNFRSPEQITAQINQNLQILETYAIDKQLWITETSYTSDPQYQILPGYQGGEEAFASYVYDAMLTQLNSAAQVVLWAALTDYGDIPVVPPYKLSGLFTYDLQPKTAAKKFKTIARYCK